MRRRFAITLIALLLLLIGLVGLNVVRAGEDTHNATLSGSYQWQITQNWFGGFSAIEVFANGTRFVAISDRGYVVEGALQREQGNITGVNNIAKSHILRPEGHFAQRTGWRDSEGLARMPDGRLVVSFEGEHRLERFARPGALPEEMPWHDDFNNMLLNGGFEALAVDASGAIYTMPEVPIGTENIIQVFALEDKAWSQAFTLSRDKQFQPVGADFGPDGRLYVLERGFNGFGFRTRARSFDITDGEASDEKVLFSKGVGLHDNLEGISVWRDKTGAIRLTMISDDNFRFLQKTEIVEYTRPEEP